MVIPDATTDEELDEQLEEVGNRNDTGELTTDSNSDYLVMSVYDQLAMYPYGDGTVADLFTADYSEDIEGLYSLVKAMTPGQVAMLRIAGVNMMVATRINNAEVYKDFDKEFTETSEGITCSVWAGANRDIYQGEIGVTDAAKREMAALGDFETVKDCL